MVSKRDLLEHQRNLSREHLNMSHDLIQLARRIDNLERALEKCACNEKCCRSKTIKVIAKKSKATKVNVKKK